MKKRSLIFLSILASTSALVFGCNKNDKTDKIALSFGDYTVNMEKFRDVNSDYKYNLTYSQFEAKLGKESFAVAVSSSCSCWADLVANVKNYVSENHIIVYRMKTSDFKNKDDHGLKVVDESSSFALVGIDEKVIAVNSANGDKEVEKQDKFEAFMNRYAILPHMYYVSEADINNKIIKENVKATVYYGRKSCPDCSYINESILIPYFEKNEGTLYCYDLDEYLGTDQYNAKKAEFKLTAESNPTFGYDAGFVPTLFYYDNKNIVSGAVAFNDLVEENIVTRSYYTSERLENLEYLKNFSGEKIIKGKTIPNEDLTSSGYWENSKAVNVYKPIINAFLNYALPNTNLNY